MGIGMPTSQSNRPFIYISFVPLVPTLEVRVLFRGDTQ